MVQKYTTEKIKQTHDGLKTTRTLSGGDKKHKKVGGQDKLSSTANWPSTSNR